MQLGAMNNPHANVLKEIERIARLGMDFIDLTIEAPGATVEGTDWKAVRQAVADAGLPVVAHAAPYLPIQNPSPLVRQAALDELRRTLDVAQIIGAPFCTTHFVGWPKFLSDEQGYEYYRQAYGVLCRHGSERGVAVTMENGPDNRHQLKYFREIFHLLPDLKLTFDIGHGNVKTARSMTRDYLFALNDRLAHVHISDNGGEGDDHLPFGAPKSGAINLPHELRGLRDFRYDGTITLEVFGDQRWLVASADRLRELWPHAA
jgi:sugar phosphate isomerase/epimerase